MIHSCAFRFHFIHSFRAGRGRSKGTAYRQPPFDVTTFGDPGGNGITGFRSFSAHSPLISSPVSASINELSGRSSVSLFGG